MRYAVICASALLCVAGCGKSKKRPPPTAAVANDAAVSDATRADARPRERKVVTVTPQERREIASGVVAKRLAELATSSPGVTTPHPPCAARQPLAEVCPCLVDAVKARGGVQPEQVLRCKPFGNETHGVRAWEVESGDARDFADKVATDTTATYFLGQVSSASVGIVAELGHDVIHNALESDGTEILQLDVEVQTVGGKQVLWVTAIRAYEYEDDAEVHEVHTRTLTLCREVAGEFACPIQLPVKHYSLHDVAEGADPLSLSFIETYKARPPIKRAFQLDVDVDASGTVTVIRAQGDKQDTAHFVGKRKLW